jgi:hypothetical protein
MSPNAGGGGELRGLRLSDNEYVQCTVYIGAQINFGDLTPYITLAKYNPSLFPICWSWRSPRQEPATISRPWIFAKSRLCLENLNGGKIHKLTKLPQSM